mmetsp:Transcript_34380/g.65700  ORF Transcript_34380/g.65700 Transcript_34380/m.65700 type:complete len:317 (-) Transcript_34380:234-1184(-)
MTDRLMMIRNKVIKTEDNSNDATNTSIAGNGSTPIPEDTGEASSNPVGEVVMSHKEQEVRTGDILRSSSANRNSRNMRGNASARTQHGTERLPATKAGHDNSEDRGDAGEMMSAEEAREKTDGATWKLDPRIDKLAGQLGGVPEEDPLSNHRTPQLDSAPQNKEYPNSQVVKDVQKNMFAALQSDDAKRMADLEAKQAQLGQEAQAISISLGSMVSPTTEPDDVLFEAGIKHEDPVPEIVAQLQRRSGSTVNKAGTNSRSSTTHAKSSSRYSSTRDSLHSGKLGVSAVRPQTGQYASEHFDVTGASEVIEGDLGTK